MTIQGAMNELINLLNADDIPIYYKGGIEKVIETIDDYIDGKDDYVKRRVEQTEPQKKCSTCGYSPQTPSCDSCEGYSNWWALDPCDECVFVKGSGWCDNCNGKPKGLDALPNSRKAEQTEPQTIRCPKCGRTDYIRSFEKDFGIKDSGYKYKCINCNTYIKDEPSNSEKSNNCETCKHNKLEWYSEVCDGCSKAHSNYEPQMGDAKPIPLSNRVTHIKDEPQKWEAPPKVEHKEVVTTCVSVPACLLEIEDEPQTDGYMTAEQTEDYRKMLDNAEHKIYGNIEDEPQTDCAWKNECK